MKGEIFLNGGGLIYVSKWMVRLPNRLVPQVLSYSEKLDMTVLVGAEY